MLSTFQKHSIEKKAKSVNEAIDAALAELNAAREDVTVEVVEEGAKGFLGLGAKEAVVRVSLKDASLQCAKTFLGDIFEAMNLEVAIDAEKDENGIHMELSGDNMGIVIGKRGDTLDSLQYLTSLVINRDSEDYIKVSIDTENYREKRSEALLALSARLAEKVTKTGKKFTLEPMNPYERRIIHSNLQNSETVTTYSIGEEPYRKVVISPKNPKKSNYEKKPSGSGGQSRSTSGGGQNRSRNYRNNNSNRQPKVSSDIGNTTGGYKSGYKPERPRPQKKAEYKNFEEYIAGHQADNQAANQPDNQGSSEE